MKRELKGESNPTECVLSNGFKTDPDEKGTERGTCLSRVTNFQILVSRLIPMKRELKAPSKR